MIQLLPQPRFPWLLLLAGSIVGLMPAEQVALCLGADGHFAMSRGGAEDAGCPCGPESGGRSFGSPPESSHPSCRDFAVLGTGLGLDDLRPSLERAAPPTTLATDPGLRVLEPASSNRIADCVARWAAAGKLRCQRSVVLLI